MADPAEMTDAGLVDRFLGGDPEAFEQLLGRYQRPVYNLILRLLGDRERAEDVFQDVFLSVLRGLSGFDKEGSFRSWVLGIAVNLCRNEMRARKNAPAGGEAEPASPEAGPAEQAEQAELAQMVEKGVAELSPEHREVFYLRMGHSLSYDEIGEILNISTGTAKSRMHYAVVNLRRFLKRHVRE
jgi:RNA polymerase sigma-70 factor (ECF subfamily)